VIGPCAKQVVKATIVTPEGNRFVSSNYVLNAQVSCPRGGMATGEGYHLCREVCMQVGHAEQNALRIAGAYARGATLYLEGHTYACEPCKASCAQAGIVEVVIGAPPP
jgi:deoxycytidylate deaminase